MSTVVTDEVTNFGRLKKVKEVKEKKIEVDPLMKPRQRKNTKTTDRKHAADASDDNNDDAISIQSCDSDENQFTTLTGMDGTEYHPPDWKKVPSRYARKGQSGTSSGDDTLRKLAALKSSMEKQNLEICRLQEENEDARQKLRAMKKKGPSSTTTAKELQSKKKKAALLLGFVEGTLQPGVDSDDDSDIQEIDEQAVTKPDSTSLKGLVKEDSAFSDYADLIPPGQVPRPKR